MGMRLARNLGSKECLSTEDKAGRSIIDAFYHIYDIKKPSKEEFIEYIRHKCIERECDIKNMTVIASGNKKYTLNIHSEYILPKIKHIQYVTISVQ
jgi:S-adenosylhomocysteine hydrolase